MSAQGGTLNGRATAKYETSEYVNMPGGRGKMSKVAKFGWILRDRPGQFMEISKDQLHIDHDYQRDKVVIGKVRDIQSNWSWAGCGVILVARRPDGSFWVFDGQHRVLAARNRSDITALPCLVFDVDDKTQEAAGFLVCNSERKPVTAIAKFKAMVLTKDPASTVVSRVFDRLGVVFTDNPSGRGQLACVAACLRMASANPEAFERVLAVAIDVCGDEPVHSNILDGLSWIERKHGLMSDRRFVGRLSTVSRHEILDAISRFAAAEGNRGEKVSGTAILKCVNKGLRVRFGEGDKDS